MKRGKGFFGRSRSGAERRRTLARTHYDLEMESRRQRWGADPALVYDEEHDLLRFIDGRFVFSHEHANWELPKKRGRLRET